MDGDPIPHEHHVSRYCAPKEVDGGVPQPTAFMVEERNPNLSANWLEHFAGASTEEAVDKVRECLIAKPYKVRKNGAFAVLNVGVALTALRAGLPGATLDVVHRPIERPADPSHSEFVGIELAMSQAAAEILADNLNGVFPGLKD